MSETKIVLTFTTYEAQHNNANGDNNHSDLK
jgi:hypothetical protein